MIRASNTPRRNHDRRIRRKPFRSVFCFEPVQPPMRWLLSSLETAAALGIKLRTLTDVWLKEWKRNNFESGSGPRPMRTPPSQNWLYRYDDVVPGADFVAAMKADRTAHRNLP
jgi:hypothetical protein